MRRYNRRMQAVEFAIEHDDGQSVRALDRADVILVAPSRCGKTPTSMYLALMHGVFVANYPLVDEDFQAGRLPGAVERLADRCFGLVTSPERLSEVRGERPPPLRPPRHPLHRLLRHERRGDVHPHPADPHRPQAPELTRPHPSPHRGAAVGRSPS